MRIFVALLTAALWTCTVGSTYAQWDVFNNDAPRWKMEASVIALDRSVDDNAIPLITNSLTLATVFDSGALSDLDTAAGMDISLQFWSHYGVEMEIETSYAGWEQTTSFLGPNLETPFFPDLSPSDMNFEYDSRLFSLEWNCRREVGPGFTLLLGPRFVYLDEFLQFDSTTTILPPVPDPVFDFETLTSIDTKNPMLGAQVGAEFDYFLVGDIRFGGFIKMGAYENFSSAFVHREVTFIDDIDSERTKNAGSFVGELGGRIYYAIYPGACSAFLGYEAMWIDNVATAPVQLYTVENPYDQVIVGVTPFVQGVSFGLEFLR